MNNISQSRLSECHPAVQHRVAQLAAQWAEAFPDYELEISQGLRSWNYQQAVYDQGRKPLAEVNAERAAAGLAALTEAENKRVTNAPPGLSNHNYGLAVDFAIEDAQGALDWDAADARWQRLIALAPGCGLRSGACFSTPDNPHVELAEAPEVPTEEMQQTLKSEGVAAVWQALGLPQT